MDLLTEVINALNGALFSEYTVYALLGVGVLFTVWSAFGQFRALTHGVGVVRGKYDDSHDPGAINHFQALSAALSATVGLGNIAGVALAVALGGPGAVLWMWLIGLLGMAIKMTEVTQSMLYRNTDDPENPHGGPMFVVQKGLAESPGLRWPAALLFALVSVGIGFLGFQGTVGPDGPTGLSIVFLAGGTIFGLAFIVLALRSGKILGSFIGGVFVVTLIISAITGGNMFQAWAVADITNTYFQIPQVATGIVLAIVVGLVIIGGIKRIGSVAGRIVPFMCGIYVLAALFVLVVNFGEIPGMLALIVKSGLPPFLGGEAPNATGAFLGGTFAYAAMWGVKRALFSSEAGQGSSPIAHSAAKTDEPVREGVVAGLEPFIDTIVVCTLTALVILSSGAFDRGPEAVFSQQTPQIVKSTEPAGTIDRMPAFAQEEGAWVTTGQPASVGERLPKASEGDQATPWAEDGDPVFVYAVTEPGAVRRVVSGTVSGTLAGNLLALDPIRPSDGESITSVTLEPAVFHGSEPGWLVDTVVLPRMTDDARKIRNIPAGESGWRNGETVFMVVEADPDADTGRNLRRIMGTVVEGTVPVPGGEPDEVRVRYTVEWESLVSDVEPALRVLTDEDGNQIVDAEGNPVLDTGIYGDYAGASLTAYAFDRVAPGLGKYLIMIAAWLFAVSTMISWSYYGEQGIYYMCSRLSESATNTAIFVYKIIYCLLILVTCVLAMSIFPNADGGTSAIIGTDKELDMWTTLGLGVMLVANVPIMLLFGAKAMKAYREYFKRMASGGDDAHEAPRVVDVVEGKDVE